MLIEGNKSADTHHTNQRF